VRKYSRIFQVLDELSIFDDFGRIRSGQFGIIKVVARLCGLCHRDVRFPGAYAPGFMLSSASQASGTVRSRNVSPVASATAEQTNSIVADATTIFIPTFRGLKPTAKIN